MPSIGRPGGGAAESAPVFPKSDMNAASLPTVIDLRSCAQKAETLSGQAPLAAFARLAEGLPDGD